MQTAVLQLEVSVLLEVVRKIDKMNDHDEEEGSLWIVFVAVCVMVNRFQLPHC